MFDLKSLGLIKQIASISGINGIVYDADDDEIILTRRALPGGILTALNPKTGGVVANVELEDGSPADAVPEFILAGVLQFGRPQNLHQWKLAHKCRELFKVRTLRETRAASLRCTELSN